jgi:SAM-dependent methyltransferase
VRNPIRLGLSSKKRIPILITSDREYYPWEIPGFLRWKLRIRRIATMVHSLGFKFSYERMQMLDDELEVWKRCYVPSLFDASDDPLILDAGAGEGETVMFYYLLGFRRFRCVEPNRLAFELLKGNVAKLGNTEIHLFNRRFSAHDVYGVDFAKIDVEGGEVELIEADKRNLPREIVVETHSLAVQKLLLESFKLEHLMDWNTRNNLRIWRWVNPANNGRKTEHDSK